MMLILSSIKVKDKYLYDVNAIENNDKKGTNIKKLIDKKKSFFNTNDSKFNKLFNKTISSAKCEVRTDLKNYNTADILIVSINFETKKNIKDFNILKDLIRNIGSRIKKKL